MYEQVKDEYYEVGNSFHYLDQDDAAKVLMLIANEIHGLTDEVRGLRSDLKQMDAKKGKEE